MSASPTLSYNGIEFTAPYLTRMTVRPVMCPAERVVLWTEHEIEVNAWITSQQPETEDAGDAIQSMRTALMAVGKELHVTGLGYGDDLHVNGAGNSVRDAHLGPVPNVEDLVPLGGNGNAFRVRWSVKFRLGCIDGDRYEGLASMTFSVAHSIDGNTGLSQEVVEGELVIAQTFKENGQLPYSADQWRERLEKREPPLGFHRTAQRYAVSKDRCKLDFSWTDSEIARPYPEGIIKIRATHSLSSRLDKSAFNLQLVTIAATIAAARGAARSLPLLAFLQIVGSRMEKWAKMGYFVLTQSISFEEDIFGTSSSFTYVATVMTANARAGPGGANAGNLNFTDVLTHSNMWTPIGTSYASWAGSMRGESAWACRGRAGLGPEGPDAIITLCDTRSGGPGGTTATPNPPGGRTNTPAGDTGAQNSDLGRSKAFLGGGESRVPKPENSWHAFRNAVTLEEEPALTAHRRLPDSPPSVPANNSLQRNIGPGLTLGGSSGSAVTPSQPGAPVPPSRSQAAAPLATLSADALRKQPGLAPGFAASQGTLPADRYQISTAPERFVTMTGYAIRVGHRVPVPKLHSVGGVEVVETGRRVQETSGSFAGGAVVIYRTDWQVTYAVGSAPAGDLPVLGDPVSSVDGVA
jgi:hypothetical protein